MSKKPLTKRGLTRRRNAARRQAQRQKTPVGRLQADGATTVDQMRRRLKWLAQEWSLPGPLPEVKPYPTNELLNFMAKHCIKFDWVVFGRLEHLQDMMRARRTQAPSVERIMDKYATLPPELKQRVSDEVQRILDERC